jgi:hypothetical protein
LPERKLLCAGTNDSGRVPPSLVNHHPRRFNCDYLSITRFIRAHSGADVHNYASVGELTGKKSRDSLIWLPIVAILISDAVVQNCRHRELHPGMPDICLTCDAPCPQSQLEAIAGYYFLN